MTARYVFGKTVSTSYEDTLERADVLFLEARGEHLRDALEGNAPSTRDLQAGQFAGLHQADDFPARQVEQGAHFVR